MLRLAERPDDDPVAFSLAHVTGRQITGVVVGLDYDYVASRASYQQLLLQALRSAHRHGAGRVLLGMGADLQKSRFGARPGEALGLRPGHRHLQRRRPGPPGRERADGLSQSRSVSAPLSRVRSSSLAARRATLRAASASVNRSRTGRSRK